MYREHSLILILIASIAGAVSWAFKVPYEIIASDVITIVSIAMAVYLTAITLLIGSKVGDKMKKQDYKIKTNTQMGVLIVYLNRAIWVGILSIIDSSIAKIYCVDDFNIRFPYIYKCISSVGFALFAVTIFFILIIFKFIASVLLKETH